MSNTPITKKSILSNPVDRFVQINPDASTNQLATLSLLQKKHDELKKQFIDKQNQCKKTSRLIGEAKREKNSTSNLMQSMREQSADVALLKNLISDASKNILTFFEDSTNNNDVNKSSSGKLPARTHPETSQADSPVSISLLDHDIDNWNHYVKSNATTSLYHRAEWKNLIKTVLGHEGYYFYASNTDGNIVGILPLIRLKSKLFGDFMISMPYFNSGSAVANSLEIEQKLIDTANNHAKVLGVTHIEYRDNITREGLPVRTEKVNMILSLPDTCIALQDNFSSKLRSQIKRAQRENTQVITGNTECLDDFYDVFAQNMRDLGTPVYGKLFFRNILKAFPQHSKIVVIKLDSQPVAAGFLLGDKNMLEIPWASTLKSVNHLSLNMLLYWEVLKFAIDNHYQYFDFGRSSKDSGTFRFKKQWGAKPKQQYWHYWLSENTALPELNPTNPKYALVINLWKRLPVAITKLLGPHIVKNLP